jgi:hypothetical protein
MQVPENVLWYSLGNEKEQENMSIAPSNIGWFNKLSAFEELVKIGMNNIMHEKSLYIP